MNITYNYFRQASLLILFLVFSMGLWNQDWTVFKLATVLKWPLLFLISILGISLNNFKFFKLKSLPSLFMSVFLIATTISTFSSPYLNGEGIKFLFGYYFVFLLAFVLPIHRGEARILVNAIGYVSIFIIMVSVFYVFSPDGWGGSRFRGVYANTNGLGSIGVIALIYSFMWNMYTKSNISKLFILLSSVSILATQSRGALLGLVAFIFLFCLLHRKIKIILLFSLVLSSVVLSYSAFIDLVNPNYQSRSYELKLDSARSKMLATHIDKFMEKPLFGQGMSVDENGGGRLPSELAYTDILSFSGIIGFLGITLAIAFKLFESFRVALTSKLEFYDECAFYIFFCVIIMSLGDGYISNLGNPISLFYWMYLGLKVQSSN